MHADGGPRCSDVKDNMRHLCPRRFMTFEVWVTFARHQVTCMAIQETFSLFDKQMAASAGCNSYPFFGRT